MKLTGEERVRFLLGAIPYYRERQYSGNYYDNDDLNDILDAVERASLTEKQRHVIELVFLKDLSKAEAARRMGVSKVAVGTMAKRALRQITEAYEKGKRNESN